jgi:hypothetical protein
MSILLAVLLVAQPAPAAAVTAAAGAPERVSAFRAICLDHIGDLGAQAAAARAEPWRFHADGAVGEAVTHYRSALGMLGIGASARSCALTGEIDPGIDLSRFSAVMTASLGTDDGTPLDEADSVYWLIAPDHRNEQYVLALKVSRQTGRNLATLWVQKREPQ